MTEEARFRLRAAAVALAFVLLAGAVAFTRAPYGDEGFFAAPSYTLLHGGYLGCPPLRQFNTDRHVYSIPPMYFLAQAAWYRVVGFGIVRMRVGTVLWGLALLIALYLALERATGERKLAFLAAMLLGADYTFLMHSAIGRPDMMSAALGMWAIAAYLCVREKSLGWAVFGSQTLAVLAGLTQPVGGILVAVILLGITLGSDGRRVLRPGYVGLAIVPYLVGAAGWGVYILQDPADFKAQLLGVTLSMDRAQGIHAPFKTLLRELTERYGGYYGPAAGMKGIRVLLPLGYLAAISCALVLPSLRGRRSIRILVGIALGNALLLALIDGSKQLQYLVYIVPAMVALLAAVLSYSRVRWPIIAIIVLVQLGPALYRVKLDKFHKSFEPALAVLRPIVETGRPTMADLQFAMALGFPDNLTTDVQYGYQSGGKADALQIDHEVFDQNLTEFTAKDPREGSFLRKMVTEDFRDAWDDGAYGIYVRR